MKTLTTNLMIAVAALAAAAGSASAQTYKAEIPMGFRAGKTVMAPGSYVIRVLTGVNGVAHIAVENRATATTALLLPIPGSDAPKAWRKEGSPKISFACADRTCSLARLWNGRDLVTYEFATPKLPAAERAAIVTFTMAKTD